jgi:hypothetical protein
VGSAQLDQFPHPCACSPERLDWASRRRQHGVARTHTARGTASACACRRAAFSTGAGVHPTGLPRRARSPLLHEKHTPSTKTGPQESMSQRTAQHRAATCWYSLRQGHSLWRWGAHGRGSGVRTPTYTEPALHEGRNTEARGTAPRFRRGGAAWRVPRPDLQREQHKGTHK